ncbi:mannose 6-phosphate receptor domain-containing protein [Teratosphaeria nubilosa]|uniref:Mannose 6-phosphate receptor domain-containing protein n=1 Tax=Teratosphaeria nubilosa TaxID=161662 RepID=A0A6G1KVS4_9PEZI|nr:mannose 6-phosphate receptor domain-containing protein [Teratosphaeria nubilosa]
MNRLLYHSLALYLCLSAGPTALAASTKDPAPLEPCTIRSPTSHAFFDLNSLHIQDPALSTKKNPRDYSWNTTGWGLPYNFTMNFCGGVVEHVEDVVGVEEKLWRNVSAYYKKGGKVYSIGQQNSEPVFHGRKMVMNYTNGSPCDGDTATRSHTVQDLHARELNTIISFLCDRDPISPLLTLNFIAASPDECTYFFEARTLAACGGIETAKQTLSPGGVFGLILLITLIVYMVGGCVYSRMVLNQRGWRQVPNYALWASILGFVKDIFIILTSSCARFVPSSRGYQRVNGGIGGSGSGRGRGRDSDAENRLIDELNEEWDD